MTINLAVCDDEICHTTYITGLLETYRRERFPSLHWSSFQTGFALLSAIDQGKGFDGVLLDICMDDMNGMEVARSIRAMNDSINIIFLTSSSDFAVESYQVEASDYILKPIRQDHLFRALDKMVSRLEMPAEQGIVVKDIDGGITKVIWNQLMYLEAMGHYAVLYHVGGNSTRTALSFSGIRKLLEVRTDFVQIHRSYIVNLHYVHRIAKNKVILLNGTVLPLPRSRYHEISDRFQRILFSGEGD